MRVKNLQHDVTGTDQVFARIGNSFTTTRSYSLPQTRNTVNDGEELLSVSAPLTLMVDFGGGSIAVGSADLPCQNGNPDFVFDNGDARYKVTALVQVLP